MIRCLISLLLCVIFTECLCGQNFQKESTFEWGPRPENAVFDPDGLVDTTLAKEISIGLADVLKNESIDIMVIVLKDIGSAPPDYVAKHFAKAWSKSPFNCVVLWVPGNAESPWFFPSKQVSQYHDQDQVDEVIADTHKRIIDKSNEQERLKTAATEAVDLLRYWINTVIITSNTLRQQQETINFFKERRKKRIRYITLFCIATFIPCIAATWVLVIYLNRLRPSYLPKHYWQIRLGAPHAGGNHVVVKLGSARP